jgi:hypothetical protein
MCGCGKTYSCASALYLHLRKKHGGLVPNGTIGGPKLKQKMKDEEKKPSLKGEVQASAKSE